MCDTGLIISEQRKFSCNITGMTTSLIPGGRLDWQCYNMNVTNEGFCSLQVCLPMWCGVVPVCLVLFETWWGLGSQISDRLLFLSPAPPPPPSFCPPAYA